MPTVQDVRDYANLPAEVPESLLAQHLATALAEIQRRMGRSEPLLKHQRYWDEAVIVRALMSVFPWLNTFALDGAAKVGRLEGSVEARFLDAQEVEARVKQLEKRWDELLNIMGDATTTGMVMVAI